MNKKVKGRIAEELIIQELTPHGFTLLGWQTRIAGIEVDLIFQSKDGELWLIEVKFRNTTDSTLIISSTQRQRLRKVVSFLAERRPHQNIRGHLALVTPHSTQWIYDCFSD